MAVPAWAASRQAQVAGRFYPEDRAELDALIHELLARQAEPAAGAKPRILIVPHAGYNYSGPVAAAGFRQLQGRTYDGVVVVGFTHRMGFDGASVDTVESYTTPLGEIPVDQEAVAVLRASPGITHVEAAHESNEHSLEVELPFLQATLGRFRLVPVLMGGADLKDSQRLATALAKLARLGDYLFLFSTDLSHYHPYNQAEALDERTIKAIVSETPQAVDRLFAAGALEACGRGPILTSLALWAALGYPPRTVLFHANSGDTTGDSSRVVGYASIEMADRPSGAAHDLSASAGKALVEAARQALVGSLLKTGARAAAPNGFPELSQVRGLFVTLRKRGALRGCIGRIVSNEPLAAAISAVAVDAATRDPRFAPVSAAELGALSVEVSVLTPPSAARDANELVPGRDGVVLELDGHSGVFLPQVWDESGWTREEFLQELASQKAGLPADAWRRAKLFTFQAQVFEE